MSSPPEHEPRNGSIRIDGVSRWQKCLCAVVDAFPQIRPFNGAGIWLDPGLCGSSVSPRGQIAASSPPERVRDPGRVGSGPLASRGVQGGCGDMAASPPGHLLTH